MKRILMAGAVALVAGTQAFAADLPPPMAPMPRAPAAYIPVAPAWNWSGFYLGVNGGYGFGNTSWDGGVGSFDANGGLAGGTIGINYQIGQLVLGAEGDFDWQDLSGSTSAAACGGVNCNTKTDYLGTFRGRVGYAFDRIMVYGTAGGAVTDVKANLAGFPSTSNTELGWTAGAGIEGAITDNLTAKIEYLYADFENTSCPASSCGITTNVGLKENIIRAGLNWKFGG
ncbi:MAG: outer membrane protein, partial [Xanthobacteraceae bacterium]